MSARPRRVGLLFGGPSVEHEVSVTSARAVRSAMADTALDCVPLGITGEGRWLPPDASEAVLESGARRVEAGAAGGGASLALAPGERRLLWLAPGGSREPLEIDVAFPLVHGRLGEDGRLQGALELVGIPYVGSGVLGSAVAMDKLVAKALLAAAGLPVVPGLGLRASELRDDPQAARRRVEAEVGLPAFVKPANGGSSVGVSRVDRAAELSGALEAALACDGRVVVERALDAREIECAVVGNDRPEAAILGEIRPAGGFYDYEAKYVDDTAELLVPAPVEASLADRLRGMALAAFRALELAGLARVDFLVEREGGRPWVNEVNTLPGFTPISMFPKLWEASGLAFPRLIERLIELAVERAAGTAPRRTRLEG